MVGGSREKYLLKVVAKHAERYNLVDRAINMKDF
jgi:hypothetical protein